MLDIAYYPGGAEANPAPLGENTEADPRQGTRDGYTLVLSAVKLAGKIPQLIGLEPDAREEIGHPALQRKRRRRTMGLG